MVSDDEECLQPHFNTVRSPKMRIIEEANNPIPRRRSNRLRNNLLMKEERKQHIQSWRNVNDNTSTQYTNNFLNSHTLPNDAEDTYVSGDDDTTSDTGSEYNSNSDFITSDSDDDESAQAVEQAKLFNNTTLTRAFITTESSVAHKRIVKDLIPGLDMDFVYATNHHKNETTEVSLYSEFIEIPRDQWPQEPIYCRLFDSYLWGCFHMGSAKMAPTNLKLMNAACANRLNFENLTCYSNYCDGCGLSHRNCTIQATIVASGTEPAEKFNLGIYCAHKTMCGAVVFRILNSAPFLPKSQYITEKFGEVLDWWVNKCAEAIEACENASTALSHVEVQHALYILNN